jgi:hypothetical protein
MPSPRSLCAALSDGGDTQGRRQITRSADRRHAVLHGVRADEDDEVEVELCEAEICSCSAC